ncbi:MAG: hypothetical protein HYS35_02165 [Betaproteobacteria bacterium]|nr:hypothetical protein [Betaproteobacteria bacterium]
MQNVLQTAAGRVLLWSFAGAALAQALIWRAGAGNPDGFSPIFALMLAAYDGHGNLLLLVLALCAYLLRSRPGALAAIRLAADRPWLTAAAAFPLLCAGSLFVYHAYPLSMDEYLAVFQAEAFAAGRRAGTFPPELLDLLIPRVFQNYFFTVARATGEVSASYWPGFALLLAPFAALGIPWAANPAIGALTLPALHRLTLQVSGSREAAGWALAIALASPAFVVTSISYYSMPAHLLSNLLYALLLLQPTVPRALLAGLIGSLALTLHNPVPHLLFAAAFFVWLCTRRGAASLLAALVAGYLPLALLLGVGWHGHLPELARAAGQAAGPAAAAAVQPALPEVIATHLRSVLSLPDARVVLARLSGLAKLWTWGAACLLVLAALGFWAARRRTGVRLLAAALATMFLGYFLVPFDQGHGWGYRYLHPAWFVLPLLAALALAGSDARREDDLRRMAAWAVVLSVILATGLRLIQVDTFISRQRAQVPPLATTAGADRPQVVFVNIRTGFYTRDMVQNDPFLRGPRVTMVYEGAEPTAALMAARFPAYRKSAQGEWGELWTAARRNPTN